MKIRKEHLFKVLSDYSERHNLPYIVEVLGTPNSGKTPAIQAFDKLLKRSGIRYRIIYEAGSRCKVVDKLSPEFSLWTLNETISQLLDACTGNYDIILCERGLFDAICWFGLYYQDQLLGEEEYRIILDYILLERLINRIDCCFIMECSTEASLMRENKGNISNTTGRIVNSTVLPKYNYALAKMIEQHSNRCKKVMRLNTSDLSLEEANMMFTSMLLSHVESLCVD